jgi:transcriptional regulator GlxA family with amidase domain
MRSQLVRPDELKSAIDDYLRDCFDRESPPRVDELAQVVGLAPAALSRRFRRRYGVGLAEHLKRLQVDFAEGLLRDSELTATQIAYRAGFGTRRTFFRAYRRLKGDTPDAYRSRLRSRPPRRSGLTDVERPLPPHRVTPHPPRLWRGPVPRYGGTGDEQARRR